MLPNPFQLIGDITHLLSIVILLLQINVTKSCAGISLKTQVLYFVVFATRYASMFIRWVSWYTFIMKLFFLGTSAFIICQMYFFYMNTYDRSQDNFKVVFLLLGSALCTIAVNFEQNIHYVDIYGNLRVFSLFLEAVAIIPQLQLLTSKGEAETITLHYLAALGSYRAFYILNWIYKYMNDDKVHWYTWLTGIAQTQLYLVFFYHYFTKVMKKEKLKLPA